MPESVIDHGVSLNYFPIRRPSTISATRSRQDRSAASSSPSAVSVTATNHRGVNGHLHLAALRAALDRHVADQNVRATSHDEEVNAA